MDRNVEVLKAVSDLRQWQRHYLLRQYGENGHVLPENLNLSRALDTVLSEVRPNAPLGDGAVPERETWWLVERKVQPPQYCIQKHSDLPSLTGDPWRAARFATEREAFDYRLRLANSDLRDECKETEHVFINKR